MASLWTVITTTVGAAHRQPTNRLAALFLAVVVLSRRWSRLFVRASTIPSGVRPSSSSPYASRTFPSPLHASDIRSLAFCRGNPLSFPLRPSRVSSNLLSCPLTPRLIQSCQAHMMSVYLAQKFDDFGKVQSSPVSTSVVPFEALELVSL